MVSGSMTTSLWHPPLFVHDDKEHNGGGRHAAGLLAHPSAPHGQGVNKAAQVPFYFYSFHKYGKIPMRPVSVTYSRPIPIIFIPASSHPKVLGVETTHYRIFR